MKKKFIPAAFIFWSVTNVTTVHAQQPTTSGYYFIKPILAFSGNTSKLSENTATVQGIAYTTGIYGSYGRGWGVQAGIGSMINRNIGFELAGEYHHGARQEESYSSDSGAIRGHQSSKINGVMVKPMLVLRNSGDLLSIYSKLGLAISVWSKRYADGSLLLNVGGQNAELQYGEREKIKGKVGFTAAFGLSFRIKEAFAIITELNGQMLSLPVREGSYTRYAINGMERLSTLKTAEKSWTYRRSVSTAPGNPDQPSVRLYEPANFSYVGLSIGFVHYF